MPRIEYQRIDLPVRIALQDRTKVTVCLGLRGALARQIAELDDLQRGQLRPTDLQWGFKDVDSSSYEAGASLPYSEKLFRIVLDIRDPELSGMDWEALLRSPAHELKHPDMHGFSTWVVVRRSLVRPRSAILPMTLPLRILQSDARPEHPIAGRVRELFGSRPQAEVDQAVLVAALTDPPRTWATVDVVHIDRLPNIFSVAGLTLSTASPEIWMTLGWLSRQTERWQTRLVVIHCESAEEAETARKMGQALCDRGGPSVVVVHGSAAAASFYNQFYDYLIHDYAIDDLLGRMAPDTISVALFAGAGREDTVRVSNVGLGLFNLSRKLKEETGLAELTIIDPDVPTVLPPQSEAREILSAAETEWAGSRYSLHEREGLLPLSSRLGAIRDARRRNTASSDVRVAHLAAPAVAKPRYVNSSLWRETNGQFAMIPQESAGLKAGEVCQLAIHIGPRDVRVRYGEISALIEEVFKWSPAKKGVWVDLALAGIDFEVFGDPVQELWLPRDGESDPVYFTISPTSAGVAQIRFGLYYHQNLIQSFRMAVRVIGAEGTHNASPQEIAETLSLPIERVGNAFYMARLEYSRVTSLSEIDQKPGRSLTLTVNRLENRDVLTIKGPDICHTEINTGNDIRNIVADVRDKLDKIAFDKIPGLPDQYRFTGSPETIEDRCKEAIAKLASAGWNLFTTLAPTQPLQDKLSEALQGEGKIIQIAQLLRQKVIPWALVYDRPYDDQAANVNGRPVSQGVCLASLPISGCSFRSTKCGEHPECLLHEARQVERESQGKPRYDKSTVACPTRFWGFRHIIEVPPAQVETDEKLYGERVGINANAPLRFTAGLNADLAFCDAHWTDLQTVAAWNTPEYDGDQILNILRTQEPDFIYFYCHARGGQADPGTFPPYLEFRKAGAPPSRLLRPQDFHIGAPWLKAPLVFLNACGTLGYSPDALSPFLAALVDRRKASGVLGTEVPVAEVLAGKFAHEFISKFVGGATAGAAILDARRALLAQKNPLGLVYTLFAPAEVAVVHSVH